MTSVRSLALLLSALLPASCASERRSEPLVGPFLPKNAAQANGRRVFFEFCHQCHPGGEAGLGPAINDKPVPGAAIRAQVREGFGAMPAFTESDIPERELDDLIAYLGALRDKGS